ncbi:SHOCT domain-containing protein [Mucilaginibacter myungsuensis]|uniref:SHOCT domain-containing protein n=1 Tax=Mucilaginibacter myungsuensis TaxID=649104 RepID=A0A929KU99_9SPHI|nr:SHOCT domain-containing protein [Mucilaginibacter myungsuensis]MBE9661302.1 SHOCT domain-containing protein [Mucilaginibacter myungsuensis]MDN3597445.1 SHOCT domain-containing protein [Mucilaginibacter myungsuensis]
MGIGMSEIILILIVGVGIWIAPIFLGYSLGKDRTIGGGVGLILGFFLSYLGVIIVLLSSRKQQPVFYNFNTPTSSADELTKYKTLLDNGTISEEEFKRQKARILGQY